MLFIFSLFAVSCLGSGIIMYVRHFRKVSVHHGYQPNTFAFLDDFTDGIFLGIGVFDLLPHALESAAYFAVPQAMIVLLIVGAVCVMSGVNYVYRYTTKTSEIDHDGMCCVHDLRPSVFTYMPVLILLAIHSLFEGLALGIIEDTVYMWILFTSIILHKSLESIAFANAALGAFKNAWNAYGAMVVFALLTPLGVYLGTELMVHHPQHDMIAAVLNILSAAMFIYMGLSCVLVSTHHVSSNYLRPSLIGLSVVAVVSVLLGDLHLYAHNTIDAHVQESHSVEMR